MSINSKEELLREMYEKRYYVYTHSINEEMFLGEGQGAKCLDFLGKSNIWKEYLLKKNKGLFEIYVDIIKNFEDERETLRFEQELISMYSSKKRTKNKGKKISNLTNIKKRAPLNAGTEILSAILEMGLKPSKKILIRIKNTLVPKSTRNTTSY